MVFLTSLENEVQKRGYVLACTGQNQLGKSNTALWIAKKFNGDIPLPQYLAFDSIQCRKLIENAKENQVIIFDDADVSLGSGNWRLSTSKALNEILFTRGFKHLLIILTLRHLKNLDSQTRRLVDEELTHYDVGKTIRYTYDHSHRKHPTSEVVFPPMERANPTLWNEYVELKNSAIKAVGKGRLLEDKLFKKLYLERKSERKTLEEMKKEGFSVNKGAIYRFKQSHR
jgi:hypothetical protein